MSNMDSHWGTDTPVSMPQSNLDPNAEKVDLGGFVFTPGGITLDITASEREAIISMPFRPETTDG